MIEGILDRKKELHGVAPTFLLYGPPGTSKTSIVQGVANRMQWDLIILSPSDFITDSLDQIEQRSRKIFDDLMNLDECVVLFDEMDSLIRDRELTRKVGTGTILEFVVPAFLPKLQMLRDYSLTRRMAVFFVTNYYERIDQAIRRLGRMDNHLLVRPYSRAGQIETAKNILQNVLDRTDSKALKAVETIFARDISMCNLGYREIEQIARFIVSELDRGISPAKISIEAKLRSRGIAPDVYSPSSRPGALKELTGILCRLTNLPYPIDDEGFDDEKGRELLVAALGNCDLSPPWKRLAEEWIDAIDKN